MQKVAVTGVNGFVGKHLVAELVSLGCEVVGIGRENVPSIHLRHSLAAYHACDLMDVQAVNGLPLDGLEAVISLAGLAKVGDSFAQPKVYKEVNVGVLTNLCQRLLKLDSQPRVIAVSTGAVYDPHQPMPLTEESRVASQTSPYAKSKLAMEQAAQELRQAGLDCIIVRPFNHIGPGQELGFLVPDMYQKIKVAIKNGEPLLAGNLKTRRDYTDVRDIVKAYCGLAIAHPRDLTDYVYNVCSGVSRSGEEILNELKKHIPGAEELTATLDPSLTRPNDPEELIGSNNQLTKAIAWQPRIPFEQTIADFVATQKV